MAQTKIARNQTPSGTMRQLGYMYRDNVELSTASPTVDVWYNVRNTANSADLSMTISTTPGVPVYVDFSIVIWGAANGYRLVRMLVDGSATVAVPTEFAASYLLNGVAPGAGVFSFTPTATSHTIVFQWKLWGGSTTATSYRNFYARAVEVAS